MKTLILVTILFSSTTFAMKENKNEKTSDKSVCMHKSFFSNKAKIDRMLQGPKSVERKAHRVRSSER